jgi:hypothetical protein
VSVLEAALLSASPSSPASSDQLLATRQLLAGAYASLEDFQKVLEVSEAILRENPNNFKALSRAGDAAFHLVCPPSFLPSLSPHYDNRMQISIASLGKTSGAFRRLCSCSSKLSNLTHSSRSCHPKRHHMSPQSPKQ